MTDAMAPAPAPNLYARFGGERGVRRFTRRFYALMDSEPEAAACRAIHPPSLADAEQKLFEFLSGWLGGPGLYVARRGPPMLRQRHLLASIGPAEVAGWLLCFRWALVETIEDEEVRAVVWPQIERLAHHMRNRDDD